MNAFTSLRSSIHLITDSGRVPSDIRRCLELVQTCHRDLQHLIDLRNEHLEFLEMAPRRILDRVNQVIGATNHGLAEAQRIVEKCRPKAHLGMKTPLHNRIGWVLGSSAEFRSQEPVIIRHNAAVLAELNYLRQITMWRLAANGDNLVLSDLGRSSIKTRDSSRDPENPPTWTPGSTFSVPGKLFEHSDLPEPVFPDPTSQYCDLPEPVFPNALPEAARSSDTLPSLRPPSSTFVTKSRENASCYSVVLSPANDRGLSILFEDS